MDELARADASLAPMFHVKQFRASTLGPPTGTYSSSARFATGSAGGLTDAFKQERAAVPPAARWPVSAWVDNRRTPPPLQPRMFHVKQSGLR